MDEALKQQIGQALARIPASMFVMTSHHEDKVQGVLVSWVQQAGFEPPMVVVCLGKGRHIVPLLHDSHAFALCQIAEDDRLTLRKFTQNGDPHDNPFEGLEVRRAVTGSPIIARSISYMDCELVRHIDIDSDHDLYVGMVRHAEVMNEGQAVVHQREDGFQY
jgi:flavin reductase (DIM6/NTAB) family NADH-FMN oxidoreductase RutF